MPAVTLQELGWIHDCPLRTLIYAIDPGGGRSLALTVTCPPDLGHLSWAGKELEIIASEVVLLKHVAFTVAGGDGVDAIRAGVSAELRDVMVGASNTRARPLGLEITIVCHSGSSIEVICGQVTVNVKGPAPT